MAAPKKARQAQAASAAQPRSLWRKPALWLVLAAACALGLTVLFLAPHKPWEHALAGEWLRSGGDSNAPDSMKVIFRDGRMLVAFDSSTPALTTQKIRLTLILDGLEHPWSAESDSLPLKPRASSSYSATLDSTTLHLNRRYFRPDGSATAAQTEWQYRGGGELAIVNGASTTTYRRASWFRGLFTSEP